MVFFLIVWWRRRLRLCWASIDLRRGTDLRIGQIHVPLPDQPGGRSERDGYAGSKLRMTRDASVNAVAFLLVGSSAIGVLGPKRSRIVNDIDHHSEDPLIRPAAENTAKNLLHAVAPRRCKDDGGHVRQRNAPPTKTVGNGNHVALPSVFQLGAPDAPAQNLDPLREFRDKQLLGFEVLQESIPDSGEIITVLGKHVDPVAADLSRRVIIIRVQIRAGPEPILAALPLAEGLMKMVKPGNLGGDEPQAGRITNEVADGTDGRNRTVRPPDFLRKLFWAGIRNLAHKATELDVRDVVSGDVTMSNHRPADKDLHEAVHTVTALLGSSAKAQHPLAGDREPERLAVFGRMVFMGLVEDNKAVALKKVRRFLPDGINDRDHNVMRFGPRRHSARALCGVVVARNAQLGVNLGEFVDPLLADGLGRHHHEGSRLAPSRNGAANSGFSQPGVHLEVGLGGPGGNARVTKRSGVGREEKVHDRLLVGIEGHCNLTGERTQGPRRRERHILSVPCLNAVQHTAKDCLLGARKEKKGALIVIFHVPVGTGHSGGHVFGRARLEFLPHGQRGEHAAKLARPSKPPGKGLIRNTHTKTSGFSERSVHGLSLCRGTIQKAAAVINRGSIILVRYIGVFLPTMSQGGVFSLVLRDERYDKLFSAADFLRQRLGAIRKDRAEKGFKNVQPTFADISRSHILYLRAIYKPFVSVASEYMRVKASGDGTVSLGTAGGSATFTFPIYGHFTSDMVFHVKFSAVGDANGTTQFRYCAFPGVRLFRTVRFQSDGTLIDDYDTDDVAFYSKFHVRADNRLGWERNVGQQEKRTAEAFAGGASTYTTCLLYKDGLQTLKVAHGEANLWVPLHFWMCRDAGHALLNDLIPNTQRKILADLAPVTDILQAFDAQGDPVPVSRLRFEINLYVNNLFVNPEIHDIFASRIGFSLIRVHRRQKKPLNKETDNILMDQLKWPAEYLMLGVRDRQNVTDFDHWYLLGRNNRPAALGPNALLAPVAFFNTQLQLCQIVCRTMKISPTSSLDRIVESLKVTAHGIVLFPELEAGFYNSYLPNRYPGNTGIVSPHDSSAMLVSFCLYPGIFNPSGYYNLSAGRELYIAYRASTVSVDQPAELVVSMSALNFLVRKGDQTSLRYAL